VHLLCGGSTYAASSSVTTSLLLLFSDASIVSPVATQTLQQHSLLSSASSSALSRFTLHPHSAGNSCCSLQNACTTRISGNGSYRLQSSIFPVSDTAFRRRLHMRSASSGDLVVPATRRLTMGDRAFAVASPRAWNKFPDSVRQSSSLDVFKRLLKTHLFPLSFN